MASLFYKKQKPSCKTFKNIGKFKNLIVSSKYSFRIFYPASNLRLMEHALFTFLLACLVIELTPGPNMTYLAALSAVSGKRAGFSLVAGISAGLLVIGLVMVFGAATLFAQSPFLYGLLRWCGFL